MANHTLFSKKHKGKTLHSPASAAGGGEIAVFDSAGFASVVRGQQFVDQFGGVELIGNAGLEWDIVTAGNASLITTVPTGKYWRLVAVNVRVVADANAADRVVVVTTRDSADSTIEALTDGTNITASQEQNRSFLYGSDAYNVGAARVKSQGTLTLDTIPTAADDMTINGELITFVATGAITAAGQVDIGANLAGTKLNLEAALVQRDQVGESGLAKVHSITDASFLAMGCTPIDFATNDMVFTANDFGKAADAITLAETFTPGGDVWDNATLTGTAGVDPASNVSALDYPELGVLLLPAEDIVVSVTSGVAGDNFEVVIAYIEFDTDPRALAV